MTVIFTLYEGKEAEIGECHEDCSRTYKCLFQLMQRPLPCVPHFQKTALMEIPLTSPLGGARGDL